MTVQTSPDVDAPAPSNPELPPFLRFGIAVVAGALTGLAYAPTGLAVLAFLGPALWLLLYRPGRAGRRRGSFGLGYGFGLGLGATALSWLHVLVPGVGPLIALVLIAFEALFFGLLGLGVRALRTLPAWPVWVACCWGLAEYVYGHVPFGGFGWLRLAYTQVDTPLAGFLPFLGISGVSVLTAGLAAGLAWVAERIGANPRGWVCPLVWTLGVSLGVLALGTAGRGYQPEPAAGDGTVVVGMVQGNVDGSGIGGMGRARSVTNNHLSETITLMAKAQTGAEEMPDFVLWPENSTDIDPILDARTRATVTAASRIAGRPILVGAVTAGPGPDERQTTALWWNPDQSITDRYHKRNLVPFGEYVPFRDQLLPLIPLLRLVGSQSVPGTAPGVLDGVLTDGRTVRVGDVICFELAYDDTVRDAVRGSQVLVVQSNNATYRGTAQVYQQFAITRARAMEARREIAVATTNSLSGYVDRDGRVLDQTREMTAASRSYRMPLRSELTPATRFGPAIELLVVLAGVAGLVFVGVRRARAKRSAKSGDAPPERPLPELPDPPRGRKTAERPRSWQD